MNGSGSTMDISQTYSYSTIEDEWLEEPLKGHLMKLDIMPFYIITPTLLEI